MKDTNLIIIIPSSTTTTAFTTALGRQYQNYVGPPYFWAGMYAGHVACCSLVNHGEYANGKEERTNARQLHYAFC